MNANKNEEYIKLCKAYGRALHCANLLGARMGSVDCKNEFMMTFSFNEHDHYAFDIKNLNRDNFNKFTNYLAYIYEKMFYKDCSNSFNEMSKEISTSSFAEIKTYSNYGSKISRALQDNTDDYISVLQKWQLDIVPELVIKMFIADNVYFKKCLETKTLPQTSLYAQKEDNALTTNKNRFVLAMC